ncbi:hypothetical protein EQM14_12115 [Caproiciproducens sp. NJN-50]|uniref:hypothetical protein n=1 Tax=Acutalibacteraceae TaxID=3082771 RepID=UPI000FFE0F76|nr:MULTISPECIES: hypothetical protein [Acutalibacteraceae]QAT50447.1 hypothetical protein EQM14_12115 [Caproiciproducens sp. NJN-50]
MDKMDKKQGKDTPLYGIVDERTKAVVYQGDAYTGRFMLFAVLFAVFIRGLDLNIPFIDSNWDLMLIVIIGGGISTVYQIKSKVVFNRPFSRSFLFLIALIAISALIAFILIFFKR